MRKFLLFLTLLVGGFVGYSFVASPIDPVAYQPPPTPAMTGELMPNTILQQAEILGAGQMVGPEDVGEDPVGRVYAGLEDGRIIRITDGQVETFVNTGGRPLGLDFDPAGNLIVADALKGLLMIEPDGKITSLLTEVDGIPLGFTDDVDVAADGTIYFSDASSKWGVWEYRMDVMEMRPHGRLIRYSPATGKAETLIKDLYFANGVALSQGEDFVLVNETWTYRVLRYWLKGEKAGQSDIFIDNLPGFPDGISGGRHSGGRHPGGRHSGEQQASESSGLFWLALFSPRNAALDAVHPHPWLKKLLLALPQALQPKPVKYGLVLALNEQGEIVKALHDPSGEHLFGVTSVHQAGDRLYFGSLHNDRIGRLSIQAALPSP